MTDIMLKIPEDFKNFLNLTNKDLYWVEDYNITFNQDIPFIYDIAYYNNIESIKPWTNPEKYIPILLNKWSKLKEEISGYFEKRDKNSTLLLMKKGISILIEFIFWSNNKPVTLQLSNIESDLIYKPVNINERLDFLLKRPNLFHSFIQLSELIKEMEKQYTKTLVLKRASKL